MWNGTITSIIPHQQGRRRSPLKLNVYDEQETTLDSKSTCTYVTNIGTNIQKVNQVANGHKTNRTMYWMSRSVITIVCELKECSEMCLAMLGGKNSRKMIGIGWVIVLSNKIRLLGLERYKGKIKLDTKPV